VLLDVDALGAAEAIPWMWSLADLLYPDGDRALIVLSPGGSDAVVVREFDIDQRCFVDDGFQIATAGKHTMSWIDRNTVYVGWDNGTHAALTRSGYPREARRWTRGTALADAPVVFSGEFDDISAGARYDPFEQRHTAARDVDFFDAHSYWADAGGTWHRYDLPTHVAVDHWRDWLLLHPRRDWVCDDGVQYAGGALLVIRETAFLAGSRNFVTLFAPTAQTSSGDCTHTLNYLIVWWLDDAQSKTVLWHPEPAADGEWRWISREFPARESAQISVSPIEQTLDDTVYVGVEDYLSPPECGLADLAPGDLSAWDLLDRWPAVFDAAPFVVQRRHATSSDGTRVPYTIVAARDAFEGGAAGSARPCLLTGYGGFGVALTPYYLRGPGIGWLEQGGVYVIAHIRGGGEFGTEWHLAAQREHRQRAFDDFIAVAEALIADGVTTAAQLGIRGDSNGGLLVAACMTQRPELFGAVVCEAPLLDMSRYHLLHAGASWMDEYGDPDDPAEGAALAAYSPYHRVSADVVYPEVMFTTSTSDDRVHPGHARKMVAQMQSQGHSRVWFLENTDGGHGGGVDALEGAAHDAMVFCFLWSVLEKGASRL
jgi:prolyl oligopeptidase